jgi:hypothetical protein
MLILLDEKIPLIRDLFVSRNSSSLSMRRPLHAVTLGPQKGHYARDLPESSSSVTLVVLAVEWLFASSRRNTFNAKKTGEKTWVH